jgi:hypothetical protein
MEMQKKKKSDVTSLQGAHDLGGEMQQIHNLTESIALVIVTVLSISIIQSLSLAHSYLWMQDSF